jgi:ribosome-binding ATPase
MGLRIGIVGLPNVGKSTVFNALTRANAQVANYPFCTIDPHVGIVPVPDDRINGLVKIYQPAKVTPTTVEFVDIAGLVKGASTGEGLGNQFLGQIKEVDAILHVVRCFEDGNVIHVSGSVDPKRDIEVITTELCLKDLDTIQNQIKRLEKNAKSGDKDAKAALVCAAKATALLEQGKSVKSGEWTKEELTLLKPWSLITQKPILYGANVEESELPNGGPLVNQVRELAESEGSKVVIISGKVEAELSELSEEEGKQYLEELGLKESGLNQLIRVGYELLGLVTFLTAGETEVRAWTVRQGSKAPQAAGEIHSDFERGFIKAEVMSYPDLVSCGSAQAVKEKGLYRIEGKEYVVRDGDVMLFRFNV